MTRVGPDAVLGWDIGGVNTKAARTDGRSASVPLELQRDTAGLVPALRSLAASLGHGAGAAHAVTMTAELSQAFRTKREGIGFVLDAMAAAFPDDAVHVFGVNGRFMQPADARARPLDAGASNWMATAAFVAGFVPDGILIDIGTTSTDIIPLAGGRVAALGRTDPARLMSGELVYTGAVRTPVEALLRAVPLLHGWCAVAADGFATIGDAHLWLGALEPADYTVSTTDGRPATRVFAGERLARAVCGDREMLDEAAIDGIARALVEAQLERVTDGVRRVRARCPDARTAVVAGLGEFIASAAARRAGLEVTRLADRLGAAARTAPAVAVAWLLAEAVEARRP